MDATAVVILVGAIVVVAIAVGVALVMARSSRTKKLQDRFGSEYDRTLAERGKRGDAESELARRVERVEKLQIRPLDRDRQAAFSSEWDRVQAQFVDDPAGAVSGAQRLVLQVLAARGYPTNDFEQRASDISVDHPDVVSHYRRAHALYVASREGNASTDEMRHGFVAYRGLFTEMLRDDEPGERISDESRRQSDRPQARGA